MPFCTTVGEVVLEIFLLHLNVGFRSYLHYTNPIVLRHPRNCKQMTWCRGHSFVPLSYTVRWSFHTKMVEIWNDEGKTVLIGSCWIWQDFFIFLFPFSHFSLYQNTWGLLVLQGGLYAHVKLYLLTCWAVVLFWHSQILRHEFCFCPNF